MRHREVRFTRQAQADLSRIFRQISDAAGKNVARGYLGRVRDYCLRFDLAGERGTMREDIRPGLRIVGFERRLTMVFTTTENEVIFLRILEAGRNLVDEI